jgi:hypothetical protein
MLCPALSSYRRPAPSRDTAAGTGRTIAGLRLRGAAKQSPRLLGRDPPQAQTADFRRGWWTTAAASTRRALLGLFLRKPRSDAPGRDASGEATLSAYPEASWEATRTPRASRKRYQQLVWFARRFRRGGCAFSERARARTIQRGLAAALIGGVRCRSRCERARAARH